VREAAGRRARRREESGAQGKDGGGQTTFAPAATSPNDNPWRIDYGEIMSVYASTGRATACLTSRTTKL